MHGPLLGCFRARIPTRDCSDDARISIDVENLLKLDDLSLEVTVTNSERKRIKVFRSDLDDIKTSS